MGEIVRVRSGIEKARPGGKAGAWSYGTRTEVSQNLGILDGLFSLFLR